MTAVQTKLNYSPTTIEHGLDELDVCGFDWERDDNSIGSDIWDHDDRGRTDVRPRELDFSRHATTITACLTPHVIQVPCKSTAASPPPSLSLVSLQARGALDIRAVVAKTVAQRFKASITKHSSLTHGETFLHCSCRRESITPKEIDQILCLFPHAARTRAVLSGTKLSFDRRLGKRVWKYLPETFSLPLNLAISHNVSSEVLQMLIVAEPSVLMMEDGPMHESPVAVLLKYRPNDHDTLETMLRLRPMCAYVKDRIQNTALHLACIRGAPLRTVQQLWRAAPEALLAPNRHGKTPLDLARIYTSTCPERVTGFLAESLMDGF